MPDKNCLEKPSAGSRNTGRYVDVSSCKVPLHQRNMREAAGVNIHEIPANEVEIIAKMYLGLYEKNSLHN
jgi:hypothetical protein